ncbi:MAG: bifunctional nuclease family protein [Firmicutes bacterium]|jgi:bifunctional DNase/RNase|nr:bifunctional nuclease family protein [Bacillota bacterium]
MVRMKVKVVGLEQHTLNPVVIITDPDETGYLPILIGPSEAYAISQGLEGKRMPRPMTHDLLKNTIEALGATVERVVIHDLREETFYARIYLKTERGEIDLDARPSDAIALALRADAPIYISEELAAKAVHSNRVEDPEMEAFRRFLDSVSPEDFQRNIQG